DMRPKVVVAQDVGVSQEVLETGTDRSRRTAPSWLVWTVGVAALVLITAANAVVAGELASRSVEGANLVTAVENSENAMKATQTAFDEVLSAYDTETLTDAEREQLRAELSRVAADGEASIALAGDQVGLVVILPWHSELLAAQEAYLAHNRAWVDYMAAAAEDPAEWFRPQPDVNTTFAEAKRPLVEAIPLWDPLRLLPRIEFIYVTGSEGSGDGQSA
ncbi:MAG: hypothetical protein ACO31X_09670, partial [Candidatus Nanopelagicales bacterium]